MTKLRDEMKQRKADNEDFGVPWTPEGVLADLWKPGFQAMRHGEVYCGVEPGSLETVRLQAAGGRLLVVAKPSEAPWQAHIWSMGVRQGPFQRKARSKS